MVGASERSVFTKKRKKRIEEATTVVGESNTGEVISESHVPTFPIPSWIVGHNGTHPTRTPGQLWVRFSITLGEDGVEGVVKILKVGFVFSEVTYSSV